MERTYVVRWRKRRSLQWDGVGQEEPVEEARVAAENVPMALREFYRSVGDRKDEVVLLEIVEEPLRRDTPGFFRSE